ncbi:MFS transporter [bacterium]|nr:MAG: MFS transporter [bacterium]
MFGLKAYGPFPHADRNCLLLVTPSTPAIPSFEETPAPDPKRWLGFVIILSATLLGVLDFLIVNLALPSIKETIGASEAQVQLTVAVYGLAFAVCLITGGRLGDLYGRRRIFQVGMAGFTFASALCGFAQTPGQLIGFRIVQGAFAAMMSPQVLATIQVVFQGAERDLATIYVGITVGIGSFLGNVLGGWLVSADLFGLQWRPIFFVNVPIGIVALTLSAFFVRESRSEHAKKLDITGALISGVALFSLIFPIAEGRDQQWWIYGLFPVAAVLGYWFVQFEKGLARRGGSPLISTELFENKEYVRGLGSILLLFSGLSSFSFVMGLFLQLGLKMPPDKAGIVFGSLSLSFLIGSLSAAKMMAKFGLRILLIGLSVMQIGQIVVIAMALIWKGHLNGFTLMPVLFFYGLGQGLAVPQVIRQTMNTVGNRDAGAASGVLSTVQQVAFSLGVAVIGGIFFSIAPKNSAADNYAFALAAAFGTNFVLVTIAKKMFERNLKRNAAKPIAEETAVIVVEG